MKKEIIDTFIGVDTVSRVVQIRSVSSNGRHKHPDGWTLFETQSYTDSNGKKKCISLYYRDPIKQPERTWIQKIVRSIVGYFWGFTIRVAKSPITTVSAEVEGSIAH